MTSSRREYLEQMVETAESDAVRLKALELIERMDEREGAKLPTSAEATEAYAEELADDPEALAKLIDLHFQHLDAFPSFREAVDRRLRRRRRRRNSLTGETAGCPGVPLP